MRNAETVQERQGIFAAMRPYVRFMADSDPSLREYLDLDVVRSAWSETIAAANRHNDPGAFTAFIAYEYTSAGAGGIYENLHRNVVFRGERGPAAPFSRLDSFNPEDLWSEMDKWRAAGMDSMAIPHNMNGSGGRMFEFEYFAGGAIDDAYVSRRARNELIAEITQAKGTSETHPALSPNDEWADFEIMPYGVSTQILSEPPGSYIRDALRRGLTIEDGGVKLTSVACRWVGTCLGVATPRRSFLVWAMRDPLAAPLQRVQVVKGWIDEGTTHEMVYDVACSDGLAVDEETRRCPDNGATVDLDTCAISDGMGAAELRTIWSDPDFDAGERAFYYLRVLENPTCRWSTWDALRAGVEAAPRRRGHHSGTGLVIPDLVHPLRLAPNQFVGGSAL